ncbi:MAG: hypothetical protein E6H07_00420 [Bacteroidetes bacterium]|nr:MAG: hypothetical protein E6H07_00420 [Bacteroidota bacterium]
MQKLSLTTCLLLIQLSFTYSQNKLALLVEIGTYPTESRLRPIASVSDIKFIKAGLLKNGFPLKNIDSLINSKATKIAILNKLNALAVKAKKDDIVVIHFGCHGQQIRDQRTIETGKDEDDGYDEALLPYDAKGFYNPIKYKGENHLRDDDLVVPLNNIRKKIGMGGSLLILIDACHSGTGTREENFPTFRGEPIPFTDPENPFDPSDISDIDNKGSFFDDPKDSASNMVVISGSGPHQVNKQMLIDHEEVGSLSYSFYKAITEMPAGADYNLLFQKMKAFIQSVIPDQLPMIEGNENQLIFSGKYSTKEKKNFIHVGLKINQPEIGDSVFTLALGLMDNLSAGMTGKLYQPGKDEPVASFTIRRTDHFNSIGVAEKILKKDELYEARFTEENYGSLHSNIKFNNAKPVLEKNLKQFLSQYSFIRFSDQADFIFENDKTPILKDRNKKIIWTGSESDADTLATDDKKNMVAGIKNALRIKYLRTLPDGGDLSNVVSAELKTDKPGNPAENLILNSGDLLTLKINNNSSQSLFYTVLDIYPDDRVEVLYPTAGKEPQDYRIEKNSFVERRLRVSAGTPTGVEFYKIIVSKEPMDLRAVFEKKITRDNMQSFQTVLDDLFNEKQGKAATRADVSSIKAEEIGITSVSFTIKQ